MTTEQQTSLDELEKSLWETADSLRNESSLTSQMYYMPVLGIIFLRHATYRFRLIEKKLKESKSWPCRNGVPRPVRADDFIKESAMFVPEMARYDYLTGLAEDVDICKAGFVMAASAPDADGNEQLIRSKLVKSGHVDSMLSVGNNFFFTKSLPCTLWFFDKQKPATLKDKVLFLDMRNYFHVIDTTHNEWTPWQIRNISAIRWLWRGEKEKFANLLKDYKAALSALDLQVEAAGDPAKFRADAEKVEAAKEKGWRNEKKDLLRKAEKAEEIRKERDELAAERDWLVSKFGEKGAYKDIPGLCKSAAVADIEAKKWSLNPGSYVGVPPPPKDTVDFKSRMKEIHAELLKLQRESAAFMSSIDKNLKELGL